MAMASGATKPLTASIPSGSSNSGFGTSFGWSTSVTVSNGSGSYTYSWSFVSQGGGTWSFSGQGLVGTNVNVTGVSDQANATIQCVVTDSVTGKTATSNSANYTFLHNSG